MPKLIDLTGQRFGRLTVLARAKSANKKGIKWLCRCDCGATCIIRGEHLKSGATKSCGCLKRELLAKRLTRHGLKGTRLYRIWNGMKNRCYNPNVSGYRLYGGRGISICPEWLGENGFLSFYEWAMSSGYRDDLSIDRIDVDGGYSPDNCRWATNIQQANNTSRNRFIVYQGKRKTAQEWARETGIPLQTILFRLNGGWTVEAALFTPPDPHTPKNKHKK